MRRSRLEIAVPLLVDHLGKAVEEAGVVDV